MTKLIKAQLKKCVYADLSNFNSKTGTFKIPRYTKPQYVLGKCYLVKLPAELLNNPNSVMATNWNNGTYPRFPYYKIYVSKALGKNIYVDGLAYDFDNRRDLTSMWSGWLDTSTLTQIAVL